MRTENFKDSEFCCRCGRCEYSRPLPGIVSQGLMVALQKARDLYGGPITITSGRRCVRHNYEVGGVPRSYHLKGMAADVRGGDMTRLGECLSAVDDFRYIELHDNYIHVDIGHVRKERVSDKRTVIPFD